MHEAGYAAIKQVNEENRVLLGGTSFLGGEKAGPEESVPPLRFLRELACVDSRYRPLRRSECRGFRPLSADGYAHHPYSMYFPPDEPAPEHDNVRIADLPRLAGTLAELHRRGRLARPLPVYVTEYGYETNPPDTVRGVTLDEQAGYLGQATYLAWRQPEVRMFAQFLLRDIGPDRSAPEGSAERWRDYQTGLVAHDDSAKPSLNAFRLPFWVERAVTEDGTEGLLAFGQVRPGTGPHQLVIEVLTEGTWRQMASVPVRSPAGGEDCPSFASDTHGFFERFVPLAGGNHTLRAVWQRLDVPPVISHPVEVGVDKPPSPIGSLLRPSG